MKNITAKYIREFNPCADRIVNFESMYPGYNDTMFNFLQLDNITYSDKIWVACKVINYKILQQWSICCAELVADNYTADNSVAACITTTKLYLLGEVTIGELQSAERSARSAWSAAGSAESAARSAAWSARSAAESAAGSAESAWSAEKEQETLNILLLIGILEDEL